MPEFGRGGDPFDEVEALLKGAGDYVRPSSDLRPRVLEAARAQRDEHRAVRYLGRVAVVVLILGYLAGTLRQRIESTVESRPAILATAEELPTPANSTLRDAAFSEVGAQWEMVDSLTELRRRQAEALRPAELRRPKA